MVTINNLSYKNIDLWWNKAWEISQGPLFEWKKRIEEAWQEKKIGVNGFLNKLESFYGVDAPERVRILLNFSPIEGNQKGEPTTNFGKTEWLFAKNTDILYWVGKPRVSPSDSKKTIPELYRQWAVLVIVSTLHEIEHNYFQKESFRKLLEKAGKEKDINNMVLKLVGTSGTYINVLNELITTYIENYGKKMLEEKWDEGGIGTELIFEVDENKAKEVLKMEFYEDQVKWTGQGPYSEHRQGWEKLMGVLRKSKADKTKIVTITEEEGYMEWPGSWIWGWRKNI